MREVTEKNLTEAVLARLSHTNELRFKQLMTSLIRHLHSFVREVELTEEEWDGSDSVPHRYRTKV